MQAIVYKINKLQDTLYNTGNTANVYNCKCNIAFKICESLCCTVETYIILYINQVLFVV